ncbi:hypothetical protein [Planctobacterium marinum]|uniref:Uncharacterized protein n=1 Tax=Planctobacterium marinum TaxID=1631968 RepID=A0AA48HPZ5_9ALTE|nr:hypothetical protein MACH26_13850 [Planctobacterium marinum]
MDKSHSLRYSQDIPDNRCGAQDNSIPLFPEKYHRYVCSEVSLDMTHNFSACGEPEVPHSLKLPVGVKSEDLPDIIARQSDMLTGKKLMQFGYQTISELAREDENIAGFLLKLFVDRNCYERFSNLLSACDLDWQPGRDLDEAKLRFFPFSEPLNNEGDTL